VREGSAANSCGLSALGDESVSLTEFGEESRKALANMASVKMATNGPGAHTNGPRSKPKQSGMKIARASVFTPQEAAQHSSVKLAKEAQWALDELEEMMQEFEDPAFVDQVQKLVNVIRAGIPQNKGGGNSSDLVESAIEEGLDEKASNVLNTFFDVKVVQECEDDAAGDASHEMLRAAKECLMTAYTGLPQELHVSGTWDSIRRAVAENAHLADPMLDVYSTSAQAVPVLMIAGLAHAGPEGGAVDLLDAYQIDPMVILRWVQAVHRQCPPNLYHNWTHAWDVFQWCYVAINQGVGTYLSDLDILSCLVAAISHDVAHPGLNNPHLVRTHHPLAITYNDVSPLENMHAATFFLTLREEGQNFLKYVPMETYEKLRIRVIKAIMGTDMMHHFAHIAKFSGRVAQMEERPYETRPTFTDSSFEDRLELIEMTVHVADIGNCTRPWYSYRRVCALLEEELFMQGDKERNEGLPVSPLMNREKDSLAVAQGFWIPKIVMPLVDTFQPLMKVEIGEQFHAIMLDNQAQWSLIVGKHGKLTASQLLQAEFGLSVDDIKQKAAIMEMVDAEVLLDFMRAADSGAVMSDPKSPRKSENASGFASDAE
jgi:hypothetical protein